MEPYARIARAEALLHAGYESHMRGDFEKAEMLYRRSMEAHESAVAHIFLGWAMSHQGRYVEAIAECHEAIPTTTSAPISSPWAGMRKPNRGCAKRSTRRNTHSATIRTPTSP